MTPIKLKINREERSVEPEWAGYALHNAGGSAIPLTAKEVSKTDTAFVYDRRYGAFQTDFGNHCFVAATLLAFDLGVKHWIDINKDMIDESVMGKVDVSCPMELADYYYATTEGTAFYSNAPLKASHTYAWNRDSLNSMEKRLLGPIRYIEDTQ